MPSASVPLPEKSVSNFGLANSYFCKLTFLTRLQNPPRELAGPRPQSGRSGAAGVQEPSSESRVAAGGPLGTDARRTRPPGGPRVPEAVNWRLAC